MKITREINLNFTIDSSPKNARSHFLAAIFDFQDGCHSSITLTYTRTFLIIKIIGSDTKFVIVCNLERRVYMWHIQLGASHFENGDIKMGSRGVKN